MTLLAIRSSSKGPHSLRHACATQLLRTGSSVRQIADFLGHRGLASVSIYAKLDEEALREVAAFSLNVSVAIEMSIERMRNNGALYVSQGVQLRSFGKGLGDVDLGKITTSQVLAHLNASRILTYTWRKRHAQLGRFFSYFSLIGAIAPLQMPAPPGHVRQTFTSYVYSRSQIRSLLEATERMPRNANSLVDPQTLRTLLLFLYGTGARMTEAIALRATDIDLQAAVVHLQLRGVSPSRSIFIGPDLTRVLRRYVRWKKTTHIYGNSLLARRDGQSLNGDATHYAFRKLPATAGATRNDHAPYCPRLYDFRTTFAVHQITAWIKKGKELNRLLPALSAYLGRADLNSTDRFLALPPERFKCELDKLSPIRGQKWSTDAALMHLVSGL